ncbi:MAG: hypothetical protein WBL63_04715 [Candidatus Acidiferrum sp.]
MNKKRIARRLVVAGGFLFLCTAPGRGSAQGNPPGAEPTPHVTSPGVRPKKDTRPADPFAGLTFSDDQKAKIDQIRLNTKSRLDAVVKDEKLSPTQKDAMLEGFRRMENSEIFKVLTPEQQTEVRKRALARRAAEQQQKKAVPPPQPK